MQSSLEIRQCRQIENKAIDCCSVDLDEALGLDNYKENSDRYAPIYKYMDDDSAHIYHELEVNR